MKSSKPKPGLRIDGAKRTNLKALRERKAAAPAPIAAPVEDDRVARAWERQERRDVAAAKAVDEEKAMRREASRPRQEVETQLRPNPFFSRDHSADKNGNLRLIPVSVNVRESAVATMAARGLLDEGQVAAADRFRALWETMGGSGVGAADYSQTHVDGGGVREPISDARIAAGMELEAARGLLGARNYDLVCRVCGEGCAFAEVAAVKREKLTAADNLKAALDDLATMWGIAVRPGAGSVVNKIDPPPPGPALLGKLRGDLSEPVIANHGKPHDWSWADKQNKQRRERAAKRAKKVVHKQRTKSSG